VIRFDHGVASGDPDNDQVVLWTRVSGASDAVDVSWTVDGPAHRSGVVRADADDDHCVRVSVDGLPAGSTFRYWFEVDGVRSTAGTTRTLPAPGASLERLRVGVTCCARYGSGWFEAYRMLADLAPDVVVHLGDHIYEDDDECVPGREHDPPRRLRTLDDYRRRHAQARTDADLQALCAVAPMVVLWDDHEFADNAWLTGAAAHGPDDGSWFDRRTAALQAWREWMPFTHDTSPSLAGRIPGHAELDRSLRWGDLVDLTMLDTRMGGRDAPAHLAGAPTMAPGDHRTLLSDEQRHWLGQRLTAPGVRWRIVANQVHIGRMRLVHVPGLTSSAGPLRPIVNPDQWDGYPEERARLLAMIRHEGVTDLIALSGDLHASFVRTVDDDAGPVLTEVTTPAVTSTSFGRAVAAHTKGLLRPAALERILRTKNPGIDFVDTRHHGVTLLDVTPDEVTIELHHLPDERRRRRESHAIHRWQLAHSSAAGSAGSRPRPHRL
jgi:alkaline phosphatase D